MINQRLRIAILGTIGPAVAFFISFFAFPIILFFLTSLWIEEGHTIQHTFTLVNYFQAITTHLYQDILLRTVWVGFSTGLLCVLVGYPLAYAITFRFKKAKSLALFILVATIASSYLVRIYSWRAVLGGNGLINILANLLGLADGEQYYLLYSDGGVILVLISLYLPLATLPIYSALRNVHPDVIEAARDLGANTLTAFWRVTLPLTAAGVRSAFIFAFILGSSDYVVPRYIGGAGGMLIGVSIAGQFGSVDNWPLGSALTFVMVAVFLVVFAIIEFGMRRLKIYR
jgi:spermidine/putrescine transport system permease protein